MMDALNDGGSREFTPSEAPDADARVLLLIDRDPNRRQIREWLPDGYTAVGTTDPERVESFDVCLVDEVSFRRHRETIAAWKAAADPLFLPVVLVVTDDIRAVDAAVWSRVDEVVETPIRKRQLGGRLDVLLRARRSSVELHARTEELDRLIDRMEFFTSIVRHDVLNGMTVIRTRADVLTEDLEGEHLRHAETILAWCDDVVDVVQRVQSMLATLSKGDDERLGPVDLSDTLRTEVELVRETYPEVAFETTIPDGVFVVADGLLGEVLGNVITNAVEHNDTDDLRVSVVVEDGDATMPVTVRVADDGRGIPDERKEAVFRRDTIGHAKSAGSGFGLFFVDTMVSDYGGDIWVEDNEPRGTVFGIELPAVAEAEPGTTIDGGGETDGAGNRGGSGTGPGEAGDDE